MSFCNILIICCCS